MRPFVTIVILGAGVWLLNIMARNSNDIAATILGDLKQGAEMINKKVTGWDGSKIPPEYAGAIRSAELTHGLPEGLLGRLLWQESHFRKDIINGTTKSRAGAMGIAQFMPPTAAQYKINPLDPFQSIDGAGRYMSDLYRTTGDWASALAAYNWGIGNISRKGIAAAPPETVNYYSQILSDIGYA